MKDCLCEGNGWIRMAKTKSIIYCPYCQAPKIMKRKTLNKGVKVVSAVFGTGEVMEKTSTENVKVRFDKSGEQDMERKDLCFVFDK